MPEADAIKSFRASDGKGNEIAILVTPRPGTRGRHLRDLRFETRSGTRVERMSRGLYVLSSSGEQLTSDDPDAV
jgi:hypothetical protein